jgi:hypothetical protein
MTRRNDSVVAVEQSLNTIPKITRIELTKFRID